MGSGTSRGKKVAPACLSEVNVTKKTAASGTSPKQDRRPFKPLKIHAILRNARNRAQPDCHSEGHDSDCSREDDDVDPELDTVLADYDERGRAKKSPPKKAAIRSKTYGLCHLRQGDNEDFSSEEPRGSNCGSRDVNKRSNDAFTHLKKHTPACPSQHSSTSQGFLTRGALLEDVPASEIQSTFGSCQVPNATTSLTMPVILYDGSEEELMDTIEREFS